MIKVKFLKNCFDKYTGEKYPKGTIKEFTNERAAEVCRSPFVEEIKEPEAKKESAKRGRKPKNK